MDVPEERTVALAAAAKRSASVRQIEADLRRDLEVLLVPFASDVVGLPDEAVRAEGTGRAGRFDALFGGVIVEFKRPGLLSNRHERGEAAHQALGYLDDETLQARAVVVTDGSVIGFLRTESAEPEVGEQAALPFGAEEREYVPAVNRFGWRDFDEGSARSLLELIASQQSVGVNVTNLIAFLGPGRAETVSFLRELVTVLHGRAPQGRTEVLFEQWVRTAGVSYGIDDVTEPWPTRGPRWLLGDTLGDVLGEASYAEALFALHTYVGIVAKAIASEVLAIQRATQSLRPTGWTSLGARPFAQRFRELERGETSAQLGAPGLLATDLFDWYAHELDRNRELREALRDVLRQLGSLAWAEIATAGQVRIDLLRQLYQSVVPPRLRKALGEFFTPRWLAQHVLGRALELHALRGADATPTPRVLDPSCGSGTFLVIWLAHLLDELDAAGRGEDPEALAAAIEQVLGVDLNPVSAVMARVNLLLTLGARARLLPEVHFNVFHADSIVLPTIQTAAQLGGAVGDVTVISTVVDEFEVASYLLTPERMTNLRESLESAVQHELSETEFLRMLNGRIGEVPETEHETVESTATELLRRMQSLHAEQRDDVWARVIEQALAPSLIGGVDLVVGNPPWVSWKDLPDQWKHRSRAVWERYGLWSSSKGGGGIPLSDVSTLLVAQAIATYAPTGLIGMLLPQSVLLADPGGASFRRSRLLSGDGHVDVPFRVLAVEDYVRLNPFSPDAANQTVALFIEPGQHAKFPVPLRSWRRAARSRIRADEQWEQVSTRLESDEGAIAPVDERDRTSPWGLVPSGAALPLGPRYPNRPYVFGRGYETRGLDGLYTYRILTPHPAGGRVRVVNDPEQGDNTRGEPPKEGSVEAGLFWPLVKGEDVERWRVNLADRYVFVPYEIGEQGPHEVTTTECAAKYPNLYAYLLPWVSRFRARSFYRRELTDRFPWALSGPIEHLSDTGALVFIRYLAAGGRPAAAVATETEDPKLGRATLPYPNNKSNIYYARSQEEAFFLAAFLNSEPAQEALGRFAVSTGVTPAALERLPIPRFDESHGDHQRLAALGKRAHDVSGDELGQVEAEIADVVWQVVPVSPERLYVPEDELL